MMTWMQGLVSSTLGKIVLVIICLGMGLWGVAEGFGGGLDNSLARAGSRTLTTQDVDNRLELYLRNISRQGRQMTKREAAENGTLDQILQGDLARLGELGYASSIGLEASADSIWESIRTNPAFQDNTGSFSAIQYENVIRQSSGLRTGDYEREITDDKTISYLENATAAGLNVPPALGRLQSAYNGETRHAAWFVIAQHNLPEPEPITDEQVREFYDENILAFAQAERRAIDVLKISLADFLSRADITEEQIRTSYEAQIDTLFTTPGPRRYVEYRFVSEQAARSAIGALSVGGAAETLPGFLLQEEMTGMRDTMASEELAEQVFGPSAYVGGLSQPVETGAVWTLAKLEEILPGEITPFETVRDQVEMNLRENAALSQFNSMYDVVDEQFAMDMSLEDMSEALGVPIISYAPITQEGVREGDGLALGPLEQPEALEQAFMLNEGEIGDRFEGTGNEIYVYRLSRIVPAYTPAFEAVESLAREALESQQKAQTLQNFADELKIRIEAGDVTFAGEAANFEADVERTSVEGVTRRTVNGLPLPPQTREALFRLGQGGVISTPVFDDLLVLRVEHIAPPEADLLAANAPSDALMMTDMIAQDLSVALQTEIQAVSGLDVNNGQYATYRSSLVRDN